MNAKIIRKLDMLERLHRFILEHPTLLAVPRASTAHAEVLATISALRLAARNQISGRNESAGGVLLRESTWRALRIVLREINRTARILEAEHPGIRPIFRLPRTRSYPALLASARAIIAAATPLETSFIECGFPPNFLAEVTGLLTDFENATAQKHDGSITQVASTADLKAQAARGLIAATRLDAYVRNHFRHSPETLAAWTHARHIQRAPSQTPPTSTPSPATQPVATPANTSHHPSAGSTEPELTRQLVIYGNEHLERACGGATSGPTAPEGERTGREVPPPARGTQPLVRQNHSVSLAP